MSLLLTTRHYRLQNMKHKAANCNSVFWQPSISYAVVTVFMKNKFGK